MVCEQCTNRLNLGSPCSHTHLLGCWRCVVDRFPTVLTDDDSLWSDILGRRAGRGKAQFPDGEGRVLYRVGEAEGGDDANSVQLFFKWTTSKA